MKTETLHQKKTRLLKELAEVNGALRDKEDARIAQIVSQTGIKESLAILVHACSEDLLVIFEGWRKEDDSQ